MCSTVGEGVGTFCLGKKTVIRKEAATQAERHGKERSHEDEGRFELAEDDVGVPLPSEGSLLITEQADRPQQEGSYLLRDQ